MSPGLRPFKMTMFKDMHIFRSSEPLMLTSPLSTEFLGGNWVKFIHTAL